ncbi:MAG: nicotinamide riboside transporter PnuC [Staphylococcus sp.]|nr:nicotinamide riboside transporter PnuC [Staphylococcus sp.]
MKNYQNPFKTLSKLEWMVWIISLTIISISFFLFTDKNIITLLASLIGVTALIFIAKGDPLGQFLTIIFAIFYSVISFKYKYYGEMITYLGMTAPIALFTTISWLKNPYEKGKNEIKVSAIHFKMLMIILFLTLIVTIGFYFILKYFHTSNLLISTISIATSFFASALTFLRSPYYGIAYGMNDLVLIILWILATINDSSNFPMVICFIAFLVNDCYGFINWQKIKKRQIITTLEKEK